jgi:YVTN family beta-propeller protein
MKPRRFLLSYLTRLMLATGSSLALLLLSTAVLWAAPTTSSIPLDFAPGVLTTDSVNNRIYVVDQGNLQIRVIDGATGSLLPNSFSADIPLGGILAVDGVRHRLFVSYLCSGCPGYVVQVFDIDTYQEVSRVSLANGAAGMVINPDNGRLYVAIEGSREVWVLYPDNAGGYSLGNIITGFGDKPNGVTYDRLHQRLYVSIHHANEVAVVDTSTETLINTVPVLAGNPMSVAVNPNNRHVYVGQNLGNRISVVDGATETALPDISVGDGPVLVDVDPTTSRVFVGLREAQSVGIVDGNTDTFLSPLLPIYGAPISVSVNTIDHCAYVSVNSYIGQKSIFKVCDDMQGPRLARWEPTTALPKPSAVAGLTGKELTIVNGRAYVFEGQNATGSKLLTNVYFSAINADGSLGPWAPTTPLPKPYFDYATVAIGNHVYLITGANGSMDVYYAPIFADGSVGQWIPTVPLDPSRQTFAAAAYGNFLYVSGGNSGGTIDRVTYTSVNPDGSLNPWQNTTALPEPIQSHTMVATRGRLYVVAPSNRVYYAAIQPDGTVGPWTATSPLPAPMYGYSSFELNGYLYTVGGNLGTSYYAEILADGSLAAWQPTTALPATRLYTRAGAYKNFVYVAGGYDGTIFFKSVFYSRLAAKVGGSVSGLQISTESCVNNTTMQTVNMANPTPVWNCEAAGLAVNSKDSIRMTVTGSADRSASVGGSATGLLLTSVRCINDTTRQALTIDMKNLPPAWNCEAAGLQVNARDSIRMNINGSAE